MFCAGADLKAINAGKAGDLGTARGGFGGITYRERRKPIIIAVDGLATAGGCEILLPATSSSPPRARRSGLPRSSAT